MAAIGVPQRNGSVSVPAVSFHAPSWTWPKPMHGAIDSCIVRERDRLHEAVAVEVLQRVGGGGDVLAGRLLGAELVDGATEQQHRDPAR